MKALTFTVIFSMVYKVSITNKKNLVISILLKILYQATYFGVQSNYICCVIFNFCTDFTHILVSLSLHKVEVHLCYSIILHQGIYFEIQSNHS